MKTLKSINNFNIEERQMICQIINRFGDDTHPICDEETFDGFAIDYLKSIMNKSKFTNAQFSNYANKLITSIQLKLIRIISKPVELPTGELYHMDTKQPSIETNLEQLRCGECGQKKHELFIRDNGEIITECITCKTKSVITLTKPKITIEFHENSTGRLAVY